MKLRVNRIIENASKKDLEIVPAYMYRDVFKNVKDVIHQKRGI